MRAAYAKGLLCALLLPAVAACGGGTPSPSSGGTAAPAAKNTGDGGASGADAGGGETERPFAGSVAEATSMISNIVDKKGVAIGKCVHEFRVRKKLTKERVSVSFGIDMEGKLLGVTSKGKEDDELRTCIQEALKDAAFPRSHAGVITVVKTYEELLQ